MGARRFQIASCQLDVQTTQNGRHQGTFCVVLGFPLLFFSPVNVGVYVGGVFGTIVVFCVLVAIVCVCIKKGQRGRVVVSPVVQPGNNISVVSANTSNQYSGNTYSQPMGAQQMQPTPYGQAVPPPYSYSNPAYPPTQHAAPGSLHLSATAAFSTKS
ncbi:uncharacterized protein [Littorina saxatilis]|uniref:Uncharacterized protein n=1 Tax=Littorina saxatilis TaxID=31220 RepID=A0AAN9BDF0_9CAEN